MSPLTRAVRSTVRLVAACLLVIGTLGIGLELTKHELKETDLDIVACLLWGLPILLGVVLAAKSGAIARRLTRNSDDEA